MSRKNNSLMRKCLVDLSGRAVLVAAALGCAIVSSICAVQVPRVLGDALGTLGGAGNVDFGALTAFVVTLGVLYAIVAAFGWLVTFFSGRASHGFAMTLRNRMFAKLGRMPLSYFDGTPHGDIVNRFSVDVENIADGLSVSLVSLFSGVTTVVAALVQMLSIDVRLSLIIIGCTPICIIVAYLIAKFSKKTFTRQQTAVGQLSSYVSEIVGGARVVKAFGYEARATEEFKRINAELHVAGQKAHFASAIVNPVTRFVDHISYMLVGVIGGIVAVTSGLGGAAIPTFLIYSTLFSKPFNEFSSIMHNIQTAYASLERVYAVLEGTEEAPDASDVLPLPKAEGDVRFEDVSFAYDPGHPLIEGLSFVAEPGSLVAIVGPTGAGKTTIVNLLMRFYEVSGGAICVDGHSTMRYGRDSLRQNFGMVLQDTWMFTGTIADNIRYGRPDATDEEIIEAAKFAHAHSFIRRLHDGYDTMVTGDGDMLSEGQKQLITIARVILSKPDMVILDEATSSIDTLTERRVQRAFQKMMKGRTSFVIAHRLSTITAADVILVLDKGRIVEQGTHGELLAAGGFYADLYGSQFDPDVA